MDEQVQLLKQQVSAAAFLLRNLKAQLKEAEEKAAAGQQHGGNNSSADAKSSTRGGRAHRARGGNIGDAPDDAPDRPGSSGNGGDSVAYETPWAFEDTEGEDDEENQQPEHQDDGNQAPGDDSSNEYNLPSIGVGTIYPTIGEVKAAATAHAISQGWTCRVYKRDKTRILLRCRTGTDCPFHLRAEQYGEGARICSLRPEHTCNFQPDQSHISRSHVSSLKFLKRELPALMTIDENTTTKEIQDVILQRFGTKVGFKQCRALKVGPKRKRTPSVATCGRCGGIRHNRLTCKATDEELER